MRGRGGGGEEGFDYTNTNTWNPQSIILFNDNNTQRYRSQRVQQTARRAIQLKTKRQHRDYRRTSYNTIFNWLFRLHTLITTCHMVRHL